MFKDDGRISLEYLRQVPWSDYKQATLTPSGDGLLVDNRLILSVTTRPSKRVTLHVTRPREWFAFAERTIERGSWRQEYEARGDVATLRIGIGNSPGYSTVYIEDMYKVTYGGIGPEGVALGVKSKGLIQSRLTQGVNMLHSEANDYLRTVMASQ